MSPEVSRDGHRRLVEGALLALVAFVLLKYVVLLAEADWDLARSPFVPLVLVVVLAGLLARALRRRAWAALLAIALFALFAAVVVSALARDGLARESWADYPFAYGGLLAALVGAAGAWRLWRARGTTDPRSAST